jgi:hypothetical protein
MFQVLGCLYIEAAETSVMDKCEMLACTGSSRVLKIFDERIRAYCLEIIYMLQTPGVSAANGLSLLESDICTAATSIYDY